MGLNALLLFFIFLLGLSVGSFLNVCICRIPAGESVVYEPSHCPKCQARLGATELIPVVSFLALRGRCRHCGARISSRYPLVELATGLIFAFVFVIYQPHLLPILKYVTLFAILIVVSFIDYDHQIIPDRLVVAILLWGLIFQLISPEITWANALGGALLGGGLLFLAAVVSKGGMGGGDIKLMFAAGFILGLPMTGLALFLSFAIGAAVGIVLMLAKKVGRKQMIAFGPFLCLGIMMAVLWGDKILGWYLNLINI